MLSQFTANVYSSHYPYFNPSQKLGVVEVKVAYLKPSVSLTPESSLSISAEVNNNITMTTVLKHFELF